MKCPFCDVEMIHGYLNSGEMIWSTKKHKLSINPGRNEQYILSLKRPMWQPHHIESDCCPKCKRIIIDASGYEGNIE